MNYAFNLSAAGVMTAMHKQDVAANNLANVETVGFKPDTAFTIPRQAARVEQNLYNLPSNRLLEKLGAGVLLAPSRTSFAQGAIESGTGSPLDVAIEGEGFLTVSATGSGGGDDRIRLTRDGRLALDAHGRLVTAADGHLVLDSSDRTITLAPGQPVQIDGDGQITQNGTRVARLGFVEVSSNLKAGMKKVGANLYVPTAQAVASRRPATGRLVQNAIERAAVDPIKAMMDVSDAASSVNTGIQMMQISDDLMSRSINTLGRVT